MNDDDRSEDRRCDPRPVPAFLAAGLWAAAGRAWGIIVLLPEPAAQRVGAAHSAYPRNAVRLCDGRDYRSPVHRDPELDQAASGKRRIIGLLAALWLFGR